MIILYRNTSYDFPLYAKSVVCIRVCVCESGNLSDRSWATGRPPARRHRNRHQSAASGADPKVRGLARARELQRKSSGISSDIHAQNHPKPKTVKLRLRMMLASPSIQTFFLKSFSTFPWQSQQKDSIATMHTMRCKARWQLRWSHKCRKFFKAGQLSLHVKLA